MIPAVPRWLRTRRFAVLFLAGLLGLCTLGCNKEQIQHYTVPKPDPSKRLLAAIMNNGEKTWFFKMMGPAGLVGAHQQEFDKFVRSVHFPDLGNPTWTAPPGWREEKGNELRYATFRINDKTDTLELTVVSLGHNAGGLLANVNRWRGQLDLPPVEQDELQKAITETEIDGVKAIMVDMTSSGTPVIEKPKPKPTPAPANEELSYEVPPGWNKLPTFGEFRKAAFQIGDGPQAVQVTVIPFPGKVGGVSANINRWRTQVGLDELSDEQLRKEMKELPVAGKQAPYVDLSGKSRILGVIVERPDQTWFVKMLGPTEPVGKEKPAFEAFARSLRFGGNRGE